jgi:lipopolysaccharide/colanic/teichoic acid biosynthesis glycosyltransferase
MERITSYKDSRAAIDDASTAKNYPERVLELPDPPFILRSTPAASSSSDSAALIAPVSAAPMHLSPRDAGGFIRVLDLAAAASIFLFVLPLMLLCALATRFSGPGPVIYRQIRVGHCGREFTCFKFRTMIHSAHASINALLVEGSALQEEWKAIYKLRADPRVTRFGRFMRRYSLDELPQLFNVFIGDMSIVGPRPIVADEIERYGEQFADYCSVKPGITGLWQVSGRHSLSYEERVRLDSEYAQNKSVRLDLLILWKTIPVVFYGQNE